MIYSISESRPGQRVLGKRRTSINDLFLSSYMLGIYTGCSLGCAYCDGWAHMPLNFSEPIRVPLDLPARLSHELGQIDRGDLIAITALSDAYQPVERTYRLTRQVLEIFAEAHQPCLILTKSPDILDDVPLLQRIHQRSLAVVMTTLITADPHVRLRTEEKSPPDQERFEMLRAIKRAGIPVGVAIIPIIPYVNDTSHSLTRLLQTCADIGVDFVVWDYLHIPNAQHRHRVFEMLARIGSYPNSYYRDLYGDAPLPKLAYRNQTHIDMLNRCDDLGLAPRLPHRYFAGRIKPANEAALLLKHRAFRDAIMGRQAIAEQHRQLADRIYQGIATASEIRANPLWSTINTILARASRPAS